MRSVGNNKLERSEGVNKIVQFTCERDSAVFCIDHILYDIHFLSQSISLETFEIIRLKQRSYLFEPKVYYMYDFEHFYRSDTYFNSKKNLTKKPERLA